MSFFQELGELAGTVVDSVGGNIENSMNERQVVIERIRTNNQIAAANAIAKQRNNQKLLGIVETVAYISLALFAIYVLAIIVRNYKK